MVGNTINGKIKIFNSIPKVFSLKPNVFGYDKLDASIHYSDGFRDLVKPTIEANQYLTTLYFDTENDIYTYEVETYSDEDIILQENESEYLKYQERVSKGKEKYLKLCGEFRLSRNKGSITQEFYELLEDTLEPVRTELVNGQFITAKRKLIAIGSSIISQELYDRFYNSIQTDIDELY
jgi:hypothetical protein